MNLVRKEYSSAPLTQQQVEKIGNAIIFLSERIRPLFKTKVLKLLYLIEEVSVRVNGIPFFGVDFELWQFGPVVKDVYIDLSEQGPVLSKFIDTIKQVDGESVLIAPKLSFNDDEFSDCDMEVLELVVNSFKDKSASDLVNITHRENYPWYETAKSTGYLELFEQGKCNSTDIVLDLSTLLDESPEKKAFYLSTLEYQKQSDHLKG